MTLWSYCGPTCQPDSGHMAMFLPSSQAATCLTGRAFLQHNSQSPLLSQSGRGKPSFQPHRPAPFPHPAPRQLEEVLDWKQKIFGCSWKPAGGLKVSR